MQRVAIARALVNNPDILLADEPTGALDSATSVQVMELLKEVAKDRLVIMVTHNPELAQKYSTRIVNLKDGKITGDSNPYIPEEKYENPQHKNLGKSSMSRLTAFSLSLNNLLSKKGRTILTSFAGSIGIIGIALILSLSTGFQNYIDKIQEDTLTSYPLTIQSETADMTSILMSAMNKNEDINSIPDRTVEEQQNISNLFGSVGRNDLKSFKQYIENNSDEINEMVKLIRYNYEVTPTIYRKNSNGEILKINPSDFMASLIGSSSSMMDSMMSMFAELPEDEEMAKEQFEIIEGDFPKEYDEIVLVLPTEKTISDFLLYGLGLKDQTEIQDSISKLMAGEKVENTQEPLKYTYDDLKSIELRLVDGSSIYKYNEQYNVYEDMSNDETYMNNVYNNSIPLKIVGIVKPTSTTSTAGVLYTRKLTEYVINKASQSEIVKKQLENENINVFNGKDFNEKDESTGIDFQDLVTIDEEAISSAFNIDLNESDIEKMTSGYMQEISKSITADTSGAQADIVNNLGIISKNILNDYISANKIAGFATIKLSDVKNIVSNGLEDSKNQLILKEMEEKYVIPQETFKQIYNGIISGFLEQYVTMNTETQEEKKAILAPELVDTLVDTVIKQDAIISGTNKIAISMTEAKMQKAILTKVGELTGELMESLASSFNIDTDKFANAFKFEMNEEEVRRLMESMSAASAVENAETNLLELGYQDINEPTSIYFYFKDFNSKENFLNFIDDYNNKMEQENEEKVLSYTDLTGLLMSSVKTIIDSVSYVLIAFVSISLIVSSIMIGIITYISVLERTKEIGVLRAIGASKKNISSIFNAETFIEGLFAGMLGIIVTLLILIPINLIIHSINTDITAVLPISGAVTLVILSVILTWIGGLIPSKAAAKKDPVLALRTE